MQRGALVVSLGMLAGCYSGDIRFSRQTLSPDESLCASIVIRISGANPQRQDVFVGIGDKDEKCTPQTPHKRPASEHFALKRSYSVTRSIDWNLEWASNDHLKVEIFDCAKDRRHPDKSCLYVDSLSLLRKGPRETFIETGTRNR